MSLSLSPLPVEKGPPERGPGLTRHVLRLGLALLLAASAFALPDPATAAPPEVRPPAEVRSAPAQFIVVAVANPVTGRPAAVGGTAHGYGTTTNYRVSATATSLIRELARNHSLTLVSEWPIEQLQMHCVLFRIPPGTTREAVIEKLMTDKRVLIAQPLNEFESATNVRLAVRRSVCAPAVERQRAGRGRGAQFQPRRRHTRGHHRHRRRHRAPRPRRPHAGHAQLHRRRCGRIPQRPARHAGGRPDRRGRQQRHRHRGRGTRREAHGLQGLLAADAQQPGPLQFIHAGAGAGRRAGRPGAGHQSQPGGPERPIARGAGRQGDRGRRHRGGRRVRGPALYLPGQTTARVAGGRGGNRR